MPRLAEPLPRLALRARRVLAVQPTEADAERAFKAPQPPPRAEAHIRTCPQPLKRLLGEERRGFGLDRVVVLAAAGANRAVAVAARQVRLDAEGGVEDEPRAKRSRGDGGGDSDEDGEGAIVDLTDGTGITIAGKGRAGDDSEE